MTHKAYYIGDWAVQIGPIYAETSFNHAAKGLDFINYGHWLMEAIQSTGNFQVTSVPTWDFYNMKPGEYEKVLASHDIVIFSDVEAKNFQLHPQFFNRHLFGTKVLTFPDRVRLTVEAVRSGVHFMFLGGWLSFNGELGKGGWGRTPLREILPVECLEVEDLRESTEGFCAEAVKKGHPLLKGVNLATMPPILGFNRVKAARRLPGHRPLEKRGRSGGRGRAIRQGPRVGLHLRPGAALGLQFRLLETVRPVLVERRAMAD